MVKTSNNPMVLTTAMLLLVITSHCGGADETTTLPPALQILKAKCGRCHDEKNNKARLNLTTLAGILLGSESGAVIDRDPGNSVLWEMIESQEMPPEDEPALTKTEKDVLWRWLQSSQLAEKIQPTRVTQRDVLPILELRCTVCHGKRLQEGGLDLRSRASILKGGKSGPAVVFGKPEESLILKRIQAGQMPPKRRIVEVSVQVIPDTETAIISQWIEQGIPEDPAQPGEVSVTGDPAVSDEDRQFWAFRSPLRPQIPAGGLSSLNNPIDSFVYQKLQRHQLTFSTGAAKATLIRRLYLDLLGIPPTPEQVTEFFNDSQPLAYEKLVDKVLASPAYGERWGGLWLDLAGYADSEGIQESDPLRPWNYLYRDYVIRSFNADKPFSQFILQQLAGDELADYSDPSQITDEVFDNLIATGFLRQSSDGTFANITGFVPDRQRYISSVMQVYSSAILGLTMKCARCHPHKFDPIPQRDYYRLLDVFKGALDENHWYSPLERGTSAHKPERYLSIMKTEDREALEIYNQSLNDQIQRLQKELGERQQAEIAVLEQRRIAELPEVLQDDVRAMLAVVPGKRTKIQEYLAARFEKSVRVPLVEAERVKPELAAYREAKTAAIKSLEGQRKAPTKIRALWDSGDPSATYLLTRGNYLRPAQRVDAGVPSVLTDGRTPFVADKLPANAVGTGRRLALARWTVRPEHPLTARVMVNRIWKHHFQQGLVKTLDNFGLAGSRPSHPELLDWLAMEFIESGWSIKQIHYLITTSRTYMQASTVTAEHLTQDPGNQWLARMPMRRLDAEMLRDSLLAIADGLSNTPFGPADAITPRDDGLVTANAIHGGWRRSIYILHRRTKMPTLLTSFDRPGMSPNCVQRTVSTVVPQALHLMNNEQVMRWAQLFADRVIRQAGQDPKDRIHYAYLCAIGREPDPEEMELASKLLNQLTDRWSNTEEPDIHRKALENFCHALVNSAAFIYVD